MRTREEMETIARNMESAKLLKSYAHAIEQVQYAVLRGNGEAMNHTAEEWDIVAEVAHAEILRRMAK